MSGDAYRRIYRVVRRIPKGRVATYGQVAQIAGASGARQVGYALHSLPNGEAVPWHRVVNARGMVSARTWSDNDRLQRILLEAEGVEFDTRDRIALGRYRWEPRARKRRAQ